MGKTIVLIDDDRAICDAFDCALSAMGHDVVSAQNAPQALARLDGRVPDIVIADLHLLVGDGISAVQAVRACLAADVPGAVLTGDTTIESAAKVKGAGLHLLHKPANLESLSALLNVAARSR